MLIRNCVFVRCYLNERSHVRLVAHIVAPGHPWRDTSSSAFGVCVRVGWRNMLLIYVVILLHVQVCKWYIAYDHTVQTMPLMFRADVEHARLPPARRTAVWHSTRSVVHSVCLLQGHVRPLTEMRRDMLSVNNSKSAVVVAVAAAGSADSGNRLQWNMQSFSAVAALLRM